jgi:transcriptional regulator with XRE-family HTH domain
MRRVLEGGTTMPERKMWKNCNRFSEKLGQKILQLGLNGQKLARKSEVSDSEISRIMNGRSLPGLENALSLARAVGVSLDYLADDALDAEPNRPQESASELQTSILKLVREIGTMQTHTILEITRNLGYELASRRLIEAKPVVTVEPARPAVTPIPSSGRASSA